MQLKNTLEEVVYDIAQYRDERQRASQENMILMNEGKLAQDKLNTLQARGDDLQHQIRNEQEK